MTGMLYQNKVLRLAAQALATKLKKEYEKKAKVQSK